MSERRWAYFLPFFFFFFLSDAAAGCDVAEVGPLDTALVADAAAVGCDGAAAAGAGCGSGFASCSGCSEPAMASIMALLKISSLPRIADERVRYLSVVVSSVTLSVRLHVDARDLTR